MKKEDKRGRLDRDVDKKISRETFVQNEKNRRYAQKHPFTGVGVNCNRLVNYGFTSPFFCTSIEYNNLGDEPKEDKILKSRFQKLILIVNL